VSKEVAVIHYSALGKSIGSVELVRARCRLLYLIDARGHFGNARHYCIKEK
jgi:hypothetical protein